MSFNPITDENTAAGLPAGTTVPQQAGVSNIDSGIQPELGVGFPWTISKEFSWLDYGCFLDCELDAGQALHKCLPQASYAVDHLGGVDVAKPLLQQASTDGVNLKSNSKGVDVIQAMATSTYIFRLHGYGVRAGYKVPIPKLLTVGGVAVTPAQRQWATNRLVGNQSGIPIWMGQWDLWYYVAVPPTGPQAPPANLSDFVTGTFDPPSSQQIPVSLPDSNSIPGGRPPLQGFIAQKGQ